MFSTRFLLRAAAAAGTRQLHGSAMRLAMGGGKTAESVAKAPALDTFSRCSLGISVVDKPGALVEVLQVFAREGINIRRIESAHAHSTSWDYDFSLSFEGDENDDKVKKVLDELRTFVHSLTINGTTRTPWFPVHIADLDKFATRELEYGEDIGSDHPGFSDPEYRKRRTDIVSIAKTYRYGNPIPRVDYTETELATWKTVYTRVMELVPRYACREYQYYMPLLQDKCGYGPDNIPQLEDISRFLQASTGFRLRPVSGLLTSRDFLNGLAHRTFHSTQYIRHASKPLYTPEPDICHELLGHVPLFADRDFANFSQEVGLASLGASDKDIERLAALYWFTVEFGVVKQMGSVKAYGAGLLSSFGELEWCFSGKAEMRPFDLHAMTETSFPITTFQPLYFVAESFRSMTEKVREFSTTMSRGFKVNYNPYALTAECVEM